MNYIIPKRLHFLGIGGAGMNPLAQIAVKNDCTVSGSDKNIIQNLDELNKLGIKAWSPHSLNIFKKLGYIPEAVVYSTAITEDNEEFKYLKEKGVQILHRSDLLQIFANQCKKQVVIAGTHGKTTTTSLLIWILEKAQMNPCWSVGGIIKNLGASSWSNQKEIFVLEGDESDQSFLKTNPDYALVTSVEPDHLENYENSFDVQLNKFQEFIDKSKNIILGNEPPLPLKRGKNTIVYDQGSHPEVFKKIQFANLSGIHNKLNALGAILLAEQIGIQPEKSIEYLKDFPGIKRRFETVFYSQKSNIRIVDDYAHHPTEIKVAIDTGYEIIKKQNKGRLLVVFQPHLPTRLRDLWCKFIESLSDARIDILFLADLYLARGKHIDGINSSELAKNIMHSNLHYIEGSLENLINVIAQEINKDDLILLLGAGDITNIQENLINQINQKLFDLANC